MNTSNAQRSAVSSNNGAAQPDTAAHGFRSQGLRAACLHRVSLSACPAHLRPPPYPQPTSPPLHHSRLPIVCMYVCICFVGYVYASSGPTGSCSWRRVGVHEIVGTKSWLIIPSVALGSALVDLCTPHGAPQRAVRSPHDSSAGSRRLFTAGRGLRPRLAAPHLTARKKASRQEPADCPVEQPGM